MALKKYGRLLYKRPGAASPKPGWVMDGIPPHVAIKLKAIFHRVPKYETDKFLFDDRPETCFDLHWFLERYPMEMSSFDRILLAARKDEHIARLDEMERIMMPDYSPAKLQMKLPPRDYQARGVDLLLKTKRLLCGDSIGLGKTVIGIGALVHPELRPGLVVVQTHLPQQWKEQIAKFTDLEVHKIEGTKPYSLPKADVYIMKYSCLTGWVDVLVNGFFKSVIFDEIQELRRSESLKYATARKLCGAVDYALGLSASPIYNYGEEMYNIANLLREGCLGSRDDFMREWAGGWGRTIKSPEALGTYLRENFIMLRRTRADVRMELPQINKIVHTVDYDKEAVAKVEDIARTLAMSVRTGTFTERGQAARELDMMMRQVTGVSKAKFVAEYVKLFLENKEPVLLAGWHRDVYDIWLEELKDYNPVMYTGSESPKQKDEARRKFIEGESNIMIISLRSGIGLDGLQHRAKTVVFGELDWSPAVHDQVIGRLDRDGQKDQVTAVYLVSEEGSDPPIIDLLGLKASQARDIVDPGLGIQQVHSDDSRIKLLADYVLGRKGAKQEEGSQSSEGQGSLVLEVSQ